MHHKRHFGASFTSLSRQTAGLPYYNYRLRDFIDFFQLSKSSTPLHHSESLPIYKKVGPITKPIQNLLDNEDNYRKAVAGSMACILSSHSVEPPDAKLANLKDEHH